MEVWSEIPQYEGLYEISNLGRVRSLKFAGGQRQKIIKPTCNSKGYQQIGLWKDKKRQVKYIHRLVATSFVKNPMNLNEVNHIDEDKSNNRFDNLEWCTRRYNMTYGNMQKKIKNNMKYYKRPIVMINESGEVLKRWSSAADAERSDGFDAASICNCCRGRVQKVRGKIFKYEKEVI